jgi:hypothetical protein
MHMTPPQTAFSLLCNATNVSSFRREAHEDLRVSFERFAVTDGAIQDACTRMENAAYELRAHSIDPAGQKVDPPARRNFLSAQRDLKQATHDLFALLQNDFTWFFASYSRIATDPRYVAARRFAVSDWASSPALLLDLIYQCLYVPEFAAEIVSTWSTLATDQRVTRIESVSGENALVRVARQLASRADASTTADAGQNAKALCDAMEAEYVSVGWVHCW